MQKYTNIYMLTSNILQSGRGLSQQPHTVILLKSAWWPSRLPWLRCTF